MLLLNPSRRPRREGGEVMSTAKEGRLRQPVARWLIHKGLMPIHEVKVCCGYCDVVGVRFGDRISREIPPVIETHAVELKLQDFAGVFRQATSNAHGVNYSWCAMPVDRVLKMRPKTLEQLRQSGIGLLRVDGETVNIVIPAAQFAIHIPDGFHRTLWRRRNEHRPVEAAKGES